MHKRIGYGCLLTALLAAPPAHAAWFVGMNLSGFKPDMANLMLINNGAPYSAPYSFDQYTVNSNKGLALSGLIGYQWKSSDQGWFPAHAFALRYQHSFPQTIKGSILQYSLPAFNNYTYTWQATSDYLSTYARAELYRGARFIPFLDGGIGWAMNRANRFSDAARPEVSPRLSPGFASNTEHNFAYNVGAGLAFLLMPQCTLSLQYEFQNLGSLKSGRGSDLWDGEALNAGDYKLNMITLGFNYYFDKPVATK